MKITRLFNKNIFSDIWYYAKSKIKKILIALGIIGVALAAGNQIINQPKEIPILGIMPELAAVQSWQKPTTDDQWKEDVKIESLNVKHNEQLDQMQQNLTEKLPKVQKDLDKFVNCPECIKWELTERFKQLEYDKKGLSEGKTLQQWVDSEYQSQFEYYQWKTGKIEQSLERIAKEKELRATKKVDRSKEILGTVYYVDSSNCVQKLTGTWTFTNASTVVSGTGGAVSTELTVGNHVKVSSSVQWYTVSATSTDNAFTISATFNETTVTDTADLTCRNTYNGTATTTPYSVIDQFTEVARSAGDRVVIRRTATAKIDDRTDTNFTSDGTIKAPLVIEADYDNVFADFTTSAGTSTLTFGSTTITMTEITGIDVGDWVYNPADSSREYAYEVSATTTTSLTLYLPFKGTAGTGITLTIMPDNPQWNIAAGDFQWVFTTDDNWKVQGIDIRGTDANGQIAITTSFNQQFIDCIFIGNSTSAYGIVLLGDNYLISLKKIRTLKEVFVMYIPYADSYGSIYIYDSLIIGDGSNTIFAFLAGGQTFINFYIYDSKVGSSLSPILDISGGNIQTIFRGRNFSTVGTGKIFDIVSGGSFDIKIEDYQGIKGNNQQFLLSTADDTPQVLSTSTVVRSGGGATSLELRPTTNFGTAWDFSKVQLFEYPIYADTTSKTYSMYFAVLTDALFGANPTASELWVECEYWGNSTTDGSSNARRLTKSTGTFNASSTAWQAISVTCQPAQNGILYLRGLYSKTLEGNASNTLFMDTSPVQE